MDFSGSRSARAAQFKSPDVIAQAFEYPSGAQEVAHTHPRAQLIHGITGLIRVRTPTAYWTLTPRQALLIPARVEHELEMVGSVSLRSVYLPAPDPFEVGPDSSLLPVSNLLREAIVAMAEAPPESAPDSRSAILAQLILRLLADATAAVILDAGRLPLPQHPRLRKICEMLITTPGNNDTLDQWGDRLGASSRTLARLFQRETGMAFAKWREQARVTEAMCRLSMNEAIATVAASLGYADTNSFAVMFKRVLNITPQRYQSLFAST